MNTPTAIAVLEFDSIAVGVRAADAMVKRAPIETLPIGTVSPGKFIVIVGGSVAAVEESRRAGMEIGSGHVTDEIFLPDVHAQVYTAVSGMRRENDGDALGVLETSAIPIHLVAADRAVKSADVTIVEIRLGDGLGGKAITLLTGVVHDVQAALEAGVAAATRDGVTTHHSIIPLQHDELRSRVQRSTRLSQQFEHHALAAKAAHQAKRG